MIKKVVGQIDIASGEIVALNEIRTFENDATFSHYKEQIKQNKEKALAKVEEEKKAYDLKIETLKKQIELLQIKNSNLEEAIKSILGLSQLSLEDIQKLLGGN